MTALQVPLLAGFIVANYGHNESAPSSQLGQLISRTNSVDLRLAGSYLAYLRMSYEVSAEQASHLWSETWNLTLSPDEWTSLEQAGIFPESWQTANALPSNLSQIPGSWIWGLIMASTGRGEDYFDIIGLAHLIGRVTETDCIRWQLESDYAHLRDSLSLAIDATNGDVKEMCSVYRHNLMGFQWTTSGQTGKTHSDISKSDGLILSHDEGTLLSKYRALSKDQQRIIRQIIEDMSALQDYRQKNRELV